MQDSYVNGLAEERRVGNYRTLPVALESRAGRDDGIFAGKLTPLAGAGLVWSETERSGSVFSEYDSAGNLLTATGLFTHQIESGGDAAAEDYEQATRTFGNWNSRREFERTSNDHFRSSRTRTWTPSVSGEGTVDYQSTDEAFEQKFWGSFGESDTRSVQQGSTWRVPETTLTRSGQYGSGAANPLLRSKSAGHALDSGFYEAGFASWGYEGQSIHTRFDPAIGPGSPQSPSTWDDSTRPDMGSGPNLLRQLQDGGGGGINPVDDTISISLKMPDNIVFYSRSRYFGSRATYGPQPLWAKPPTIQVRPLPNRPIVVFMADGSVQSIMPSVAPEVVRRLDSQILAGHIPGLPASDFEGAGGLNDLVDSLPLERKTRFYLEPVDPAEAALALEVVQIGLDVAGIVDPTGFSDGASGALALSQGDFIQAGFSIAGLIPVGEPVKWAGKIHRLARFVDKALDYAKRSPQAAARVAGWLRDIANGVDSVKGILPQSLWDQLAPIRKKIDDFLAPVKGIWPGSTTAESVTLKLRTYLLDLNHVAGKDKATWFQKALGFTQSNLDVLAKQIKFDPAKAIATELTQHGQKYEQIIEIVGADGRRIPTLFVWIKNNDGIVRLVTSTLGAN